MIWYGSFLAIGGTLAILTNNGDHRDARFGDTVAFQRSSALPVAPVIDCLRRNPTKRLHLYTSRHLPEPNLLVNEPQHLLVRVDLGVGGSVTTVLLRSGDILSPVHRAALIRCTG